MAREIISALLMITALFAPFGFLFLALTGTMSGDIAVAGMISAVLPAMIGGLILD